MSRSRRAKRTIKRRAESKAFRAGKPQNDANTIGRFFSRLMERLRGR